MYNVLPEEDKKLLKKEYSLRLVAVVSWFISAIVLSGMILLMPSYIITLQKKSELTEKLAQRNVKTAESDKINYSDTAKELQEKLKILAVLPDQKYLSHFFFTGILNEKGETITLNKFSYGLLGTTTNITIVGTAKTREGLLSFKSRLEKTNLFKIVDFPIDLLVKTRDINFTIVLK
ncbi:MAG: hypothetical protein Q7S34_01880 [bacterium]|nr:hypothetical protein [bacterium]